MNANRIKSTSSAVDALSSMSSITSEALSQATAQEPLLNDSPSPDAAPPSLPARIRRSIHIDFFSLGHLFHRSHTAVHFTAWVVSLVGIALSVIAGVYLDRHEALVHERWRLSSTDAALTIDGFVRITRELASSEWEVFRRTANASQILVLVVLVVLVLQSLAGRFEFARALATCCYKVVEPVEEAAADTRMKKGRLELERLRNAGDDSRTRAKFGDGVPVAVPVRAT
ncbi:hypothetical protein HDU96_004740, partial [Phlyctochytrium bullatum]